MGSYWRKIKYEHEGEYGSTDVSYIYVNLITTCDTTIFYDSKGEYMFATESWTKGKNLIDVIGKVYNDWDGSDSEYLDDEDFKLLNIT
jgi:hypothetical protein